jgi:glycerol kinase
MSLILAIDVGSRIVRCALFALDGRTLAEAEQPLERSQPAPDWHEQDASVVWHALLDALAELNTRNRLRRVTAVGLSSHTAACLLWDRMTGEPIGPAILWRDRRAEPLVEALRRAGHSLLVQATTGTTLQGRGSAPKLRWMLDNLPGAGGLLAVGQLSGGTLDSWLLGQLSGGRIYATDGSNGQQTLLLNIATLEWDLELARLFSVPIDILPAVSGGAHLWASTSIATLPALRAPVGAIASEPAAALVGNGVMAPGTALCNYGEDIAALIFCGDHPVGAAEGLALVTYNAAGRPSYGLGCTVVGAAQTLDWCCTRLELFTSVDDLIACAAEAPYSDGVVLVPASSEQALARNETPARTAIFGLHGGADRGKVARAALESLAYQAADALARLHEAGGDPPTRLLAGGRLAQVDVLVQTQADLLGIPIERPAPSDLATLGVAYLAARGARLPIGDQFLEHGRGPTDIFLPQIGDAERVQRLDLWRAATERVNRSMTRG